VYAAAGSPNTVTCGLETLLDLVNDVNGTT